MSTSYHFSLPVVGDPNDAKRLDSFRVVTFRDRWRCHSCQPNVQIRLDYDLGSIDSRFEYRLDIDSSASSPVTLDGSDIHTALRRPTNSGELRFCRGWYRRNDQTRTALAARRKQCQAWSHDSAWVDLMWVYFVGVARSIEVDGPHESCKSSLRQVMCQMRLER